MTHFHDVISDLRQPIRELKDAIPEAWAGFAALHEHALAPGTLPAHVKGARRARHRGLERMRWLHRVHARGAAMKGASREELAEVLAVALLMNGGPASVYGPRAWAAFDEYAPPTAEAS